MFRCKMVELFYALVPLKPWRGFLIRRHIENCSRCLADLASREAVGSLLVQEREVSIGRPVWIEVEAALVEDPGGKSRKERALQSSVMRRWGWAVATAFLVVLITGFLILKDFRPEVASFAAAVPVRFELEYIRVGGQPASAVVYQPQGSDIIIVWAGKNP